MQTVQRILFIKFVFVTNTRTHLCIHICFCTYFVAFKSLRKATENTRSVDFCFVYIFNLKFNDRTDIKKKPSSVFEA